MFTIMVIYLCKSDRKIGVCMLGVMVSCCCCRLICWCINKLHCYARPKCRKLEA